MVRKSWEKKVDNKGFTLVELIVVLVILAILAAILVPALLGYIDRAKGSQLLLNGKSVLTAAQAEASNAYGTASEGKTIDDFFGTTGGKLAIVAKTADLPTTAGFIIKMKATKKVASPENHDSWTVWEVAYFDKNSKQGVYFNGTSWEEGLSDDEAKGKLSGETYSYNAD